MPDALAVAEKTYVGLGVDIHDPSNEKIKNALEQLPVSCAEAASELEKDRKIYTDEGVFPDALVDYLIRCLRQFTHKDMNVDENLHVA